MRHKKLLMHIAIALFILLFAFLAIRYHLGFSQRKAMFAFAGFTVLSLCCIALSYMGRFLWLQRAFVVLVLFSIATNLLLFNEMTVRQGQYRHKEGIYFNSMRSDKVMQDSPTTDARDKFYLFFEAVHPLEDKHLVSTQRLLDNFVPYKAIHSARSFETMPLLPLTPEQAEMLDKQPGHALSFVNAARDSYTLKFVLSAEQNYYLLPYENRLYAFPQSLLQAKPADADTEAGFLNTAPMLVSISFALEENSDTAAAYPFKQLAVSIFFAMLGCILLLPYKNKLGYTKFLALLWPLGLSAYLLAFSFVLMSGMAIHLFSIATALIVILCAGLFFANKQEKTHTKAVWTKGSTAVLCINICAIILFSLKPLYIISTDSVGQLYQTSALLQGKQWEMFSTILSYSFIHVPVYALSKLIGLPYYFALPNLLSVCGLCCIIVFTAAGLRRAQGTKCSYALSLLYMLSSPMMILGFALVLNNVALGLLSSVLFMLFQSLFLQEKWQRSAFLSLAFALIFLAMLARIENLFFYALALLFLPLLKIERKQELQTAHLFIIVATLSFVIYSVRSDFDQSSIFWTFGRGAAVEALCIAVYAIIILKEKLSENKFFRFIYAHMHYMVIAGALTLGFALFILKQDRSSLNLLVFQTNFLFIGQYGFHWFLFALIPLFYPFVQNKAQAKFVYLYSIAFFLAMYLLMLFRITPLRIGDGDSSNRMAMHIYFLFLPVLTDMLSARKEQRIGQVR